MRDNETKNKGLTFNRFFTKDNRHPYDDIRWVTSNVSIMGTNPDGTSKIYFEQENVMFPDFWSENSITMVASKFFFGEIGTDDREYSLIELTDRVVDTVTDWGKAQGYFKSDPDADIFSDELKYLLVHQYVAFNSPVWFNIGNPYSKAQASACFILSAEDTMDNIKENNFTEATVFENGSGCGSNRSALRSSFEEISGGGTAMGPNKAMLMYDATAGTVKSGGKNRRAAKMEILDSDHGDIIQFIEQKADAEKAAKKLISAGYSRNFTEEGNAYSFVPYQNSNQSMSTPDIFMKSALQLKDTAWALLERYEIARLHPEIHDKLKSMYLQQYDSYLTLQGTFIKYRDDHYLIDNPGSDVTFRKVIKWEKASDMLMKSADSTWECGDPGLQFIDTINHWHTCKADGRIKASNPCSEYFFLDDTSCNLASHRLTAYLDTEGNFNFKELEECTNIMTVAMDIFIDNAFYPTEKIAKQTKLYRTLGIGITDTGALLLQKAFAYDSDIGRLFIATIVATINSTAYRTSAKVAAAMGAFDRYSQNKKSVIEVLSMHNDHIKLLGEKTLNIKSSESYKLKFAGILRDHLDKLVKYIKPTAPVRNAQTTVIAPAGTISFYMGAETTGIEPMLSLIYSKMLVGGGRILHTTPSVEHALHILKYTEEQISDIGKYIVQHNTVTGSPHISEDHLSIFATSFVGQGDENFLDYKAHIDMMAEVQPFLSGAISKTINLPHSATSVDIVDAYIYAWKQKLKSVAVYRDGSKGSQPLNLSEDEEETMIVRSVPVKLRLPATRPAHVHKFSVGGVDCLLIFGFYPDTGELGEVIIEVYKSGQTMNALMSIIGIFISTQIQYGIPIHDVVRKLRDTKFDPSGMSNGSDKIKFASSILDYISKYMENEFIAAVEDENKLDTFILAANMDMAARDSKESEGKSNVEEAIADGKKLTGEPCPACGGNLIPTGTCKTCTSCFNTTGCS